MQLELQRIRIDGDTQSRVELNHEVVQEYAAAMEEGAVLPPVVVFFDGSDHWLADGFHRYFGADHAGFDSIEADVRNGTKLDAQLFSFGVNAHHGLRRSSADKRKAIAGALSHPVSCKWSNNQIAKHCGVSDKTVAAVREAHFGNSEVMQQERTYTTRHGTQAVMQTKNIGPAATAAKQSAEVESSTTETASSKQDGAKPSSTRAAGPVMPPLEDASAPSADGQRREPAATETSPQELADASPPEYSELDRAQDQIADLQAALALANLGSASEEERQQAGDLISGLQAEVKSLRAQLRAVTSTRDFLLEENAQMKAQMAAQRREITRLKASESA